MLTLNTSGAGWRALLLVTTCLILAGSSFIAAGPAQAAGEEAPTPVLPDESLQPFLGTWLFKQTVTHETTGESFQIHRYLLIRWHRERLQVKTFDYLPDYKARDMESDWKGTIAVDQWNQTRQTFTPMDDGTISVGLSGSNGIGDLASRNTWWAAGNMEVVNDADSGKQHLRYRTVKGYAPSPKGNTWKPFDRLYDLVSREIDPKHARPAGR